MQALGAPIQLNVLPYLFEKLEDLISRLEVEVSQENGAHHMVREIETLCLCGEKDEALGVFLVALAALEEDDEVLEGLLGDVVVVLHEELHGLAQEHRVLLFDASSHDQVYQ